MTLLPLVTFVAALANNLPEDRVAVVLETIDAVHAVTSDPFTQKLLLITAWEEGMFRRDVVECRNNGDHGRSLSLFQVQPRTAEERKALCESTESAARIALDRMKESWHACAAYPAADRLAAYASGSCSNDAGRRISRERFRKAKSE